MEIICALWNIYLHAVRHGERFVTLWSERNGEIEGLGLMIWKEIVGSPDLTTPTFSFHLWSRGHVFRR
jgi:hypothetical protein